MATGLQMLFGSIALLLEAGVTGEFGRFEPAGVSASSLWALAYLTVIGSLIAFNAYAWLLRNAPLPLVGTYAYVNPVVAVALGSLILAEPLTPRTLVASTVIVVAVAMIVTVRGRMARATSSAAETMPDVKPTRASL
jgi:drug/metabolite transporter (DMT)-like permease